MCFLSAPPARCEYPSKRCVRSLAFELYAVDDSLPFVFQNWKNIYVCVFCKAFSFSEGHTQDLTPVPGQSAVCRGPRGGCPSPHRPPELLGRGIFAASSSELFRRASSSRAFQEGVFLRACGRGTFARGVPQRLLGRGVLATWSPGLLGWGVFAASSPRACEWGWGAVGAHVGSEADRRALACRPCGVPCVTPRTASRTWPLPRPWEVRRQQQERIAQGVPEVALCCDRSSGPSVTVEFSDCKASLQLPMEKVTARLSGSVLKEAAGSTLRRLISVQKHANRTSPFGREFLN